MEKVIRSVKLGTAFNTKTEREIEKASPKFCVCCGGEKGTETDHIDPIEWGGSSEASNGWVICTKCHNLKCQQESKIKDVMRQHIHVEFWKTKAFTPTGRRRTKRKSTIKKNQRHAQIIYRAKLDAKAAEKKAREFKKQGNERLQEHWRKEALKHHKKAAHYRRDIKRVVTFSKR